MLSTGTMVRLGKTFGNLMVDLRATNSKLRARANRIVRILAGLPEQEADQLLRQCGGELKTALVSHLGRMTPEEARSRLASVGGHVGKALKVGPAPQRLLGRSAPSPLYLGIDGGGSRTVALLAHPLESGDRRWTILGRGESGPSNRQAVGNEKAFASLDEAVAMAFREAGFPRQEVTSACLGLAGADRPDDRKLLQDWAARTRLAVKVEVTNDAALLLAAGTPEGHGVALIAGTGSIAYGRNAAGRTARAGGWGYLLGDEGSGYALVLAGLRAVARAADGRARPTRLTELVLKKLSVEQPNQLIPALYGGSWDRTALAALAPAVLELATDDETAAGLVGEAAQELAETAAAVVRELDWAGAPFGLVFAGGLLLGSEGYRQAVLDALHSLGLKPDPVSLVGEPAEGALRLASQL
jgi:N-acetylglucosamine kinase-like BadF-type ATPase